MRSLDAALLKKLRESGTPSESFGCPMTIKPIPDDPVPGHLDPREFSASRSAGPRPRPRPPKTEQELWMFRQYAGASNLNMNEAPILTDCVPLVCSGRTIRLWIYRPRFPVGKTDRVGVLYIHGGSFVAGSPSLSESGCRYLAEAGDCVVFSLEYSLAPEHPYPAALEDSRCALNHLREHAAEFGVDPRKLCISGDSAGATIAAAVAVTEPLGQPFPLWRQIYFYPCLTFNFLKLPFEWKLSDYEISEDHRELIEFRLALGRADGRGDDEMMKYIHDVYLQNGEDEADPSISPLEGVRAGQPRALIITAEFDGLRPYGECYAGKMHALGLPVRLIRYRGVTHGFIDRLGFSLQAEDALWEAAQELRSE